MKYAKVSNKSIRDIAARSLSSPRDIRYNRVEAVAITSRYKRDPITPLIMKTPSSIESVVRFTTFNPRPVTG